MKPIRKLAALAASASALMGVGLTGTAEAQMGFPLPHANACAAQVFIYDSRGSVVLKAGGNLSGSYAFRLYQDIATSDLDIELDGRFSGDGRSDTVLARGQFELGHYEAEARPGRFTPETGSVRADHNLQGLLEVYDQSGRVTCRTSVLQVLTARNPATSGGFASISPYDSPPPTRRTSSQPAPAPVPTRVPAPAAVPSAVPAPASQPVPVSRPAHWPRVLPQGEVPARGETCRYVARIGRTVCQPR